MKLRVFWVFACAVIAASVARAQFTGVWTGDATTAGFEEGDNWQGQVQPSLNNGTESISFGDIGNTPPTQTSPVLPAGGYWLNNITFGANRPAYTFNGPATLTLSGGITAASSANAITVASSLTVSLTAGFHAVDLDGVGTSLVIAGGITGTGGITKAGTGLLTLTGAGTNTGGTNIRAGILHLDGGSLAQGSGDMTVGDLTGDIGTLAISNGGSVTNDTGYIGLDAGSTGTVSVSGAGSTWTNTTTVNVGYEGTGVLAVSNGADVDGGATFIGLGTGSIGTVTLDGAGSTFTATSLDVGTEGVGTLTITNGGVATSTNLSYIAEETGSTGTVLVDGAGSALNYSSLFLARRGTGSLTLSNGGAVSVGGGTGTITLAQVAGADGTLRLGGLTPAAPGVVNAATITTGLGMGKVVFNTNASAGSPHHLTKDGTSGGTPVTLAGPTQLQQLAGYNIIKGANTHTGATTISGGTLVADHSAAFGSGTVTVSGGTLLATHNANINNPLNLVSGKLGGNGSLQSATIGSNFTLAPGLTGELGEMLFDHLELAGGGTLEWHLQDPAPVEALGWDTVFIQTDQTLDITATAGSKFSLKLISLDSGGAPGVAANFTPGQSYSWLIFNSEATSGFDPASFDLDDSQFFTNAGAGVFSLSLSGDNVYLNFAPVPEPSTYALMLSGLALAGLQWRRRRNRA